MRWLLVAAIVAFSSPSWAQFFDRPGSEPPAAIEAPLVTETALPAVEASVVVTPVPMPASVIEILKPLGSSPKLRVAKKASPAKKHPFPNILLTRTERHQLALLAAHTDAGNLLLSKLLNDENGESGYDDLALHRFYARPRVASEAEVEAEVDTEKEASAPEVDDLPDTVKLRLLLARMKAIEAHALAQVADPGDNLSGAIRDRLAQARQKAVDAHRNKFS